MVDKIGNDSFVNRVSSAVQKLCFVDMMNIYTYAVS